MKDLVGNQRAKDLIYSFVKTNNFSHAYIFAGPANVGKTNFGRFFAKAIFCQEEDSPCDNCAECKLFESGNHPDFYLNDSYETIKVDEVRELIHFMGLKPYQSKFKIALIAHAERMTEQAANSLLKTLEEPSGETIIILTTENYKSLLPTIKSRAQKVDFNVVEAKEVDMLLLEVESVEKDTIQKIAGGRPGLAVSLLEEKGRAAELLAFVEKFDETMKSGRLSDRLFLAGELAKKKEEVDSVFDAIESFYQGSLKTLRDADELLKTTEILDKLSRTKDLLAKNVNLTLALESLLLGETL